MSILMNNYEHKIASRLQVNMSKRETEEALRDIRESLYGDEYTQIHPITQVNNNGHETQMYPPMHLLIEAYYDGDWSSKKLQPFIEVDDED